jgi:hypothetical protein
MIVSRAGPYHRARTLFFWGRIRTVGRHRTPGPLEPSGEARSALGESCSAGPLFSRARVDKNRSSPILVEDKSRFNSPLKFVAPVFDLILRERE